MSISQNNQKNKEEKKEELVCPNAPKITIFPANKRIPYINVLQDDDSSYSEEEKEKPINKISEHKKDIDDSYEEDSFDSDFNAEQETKSELIYSNSCLNLLFCLFIFSFSTFNFSITWEASSNFNL